jgi:serine/threonine protein kinase
MQCAHGCLACTCLPALRAGGEFFSHLKTRGRLAEDAARLYAGEVLLMFEYLHAQDIVYRDLKVSGRQGEATWRCCAVLCCAVLCCAVLC